MRVNLVLCLFSLSCRFFHSRFYVRCFLEGIQRKLKGKSARVTEDVTDSKGVITIYDERWEARSIDASLIPAGSEVKIVKNDGLIMFVENNK